MAEIPQNLGAWRDFLFGQPPPGFKGATGFKGGQLRRLDALNQLLMSMEGVGAAGERAKRDVGTWETSAQGKASQGAVNRGLFNTTVLDATRRGISSDAQRMRGDISLGMQDRINAIRQMMANVLTGGNYGSAPIQNPDTSNFWNKMWQDQMPGWIGMGTNLIGTLLKGS